MGIENDVQYMLDNNVPEEEIARYIQSQRNPVVDGATSREAFQQYGGAVGGVIGAPAGPIGIAGGAGAGSYAGGKIHDIVNASRNQKGTPWGEIGSQALSNIPESAGRMASETWEAVKHPVDTASAVGNMALGGIQKLIPGEQSKEVYADAIGQFFSERYGGMENVKKTIAEDPVGVLADLSTLLSGGGAIASKVGQVSKLGKLGKVGQAVKATGDFVDPVNLALKQPVTGAMATASPLARQMYLGGLKGTTSLNSAEKTSLFNTAIKNNINISSEGLNKLGKMTSNIGQQIGDIYKAGTDAGDTVSRNVITDDLVSLHEKAGRTASPMKNKRAIEGQWNEFEYHPEQIPVEVAKDIRTDANTQIYDRSKSTILKGYKDKALKTISDGIREQMYAKYPELKNLDPEYSEMKALNDVLEKSVSRIDNHNLFGLTSVIAGAGGAAVNPGLALPMMIGTQIFKNPKVNSKLALALVKARGGDARKMKLAPARQGAYQSEIINRIRTTKDENGKVKKVEVE